MKRTWLGHWLAAYWQAVLLAFGTLLFTVGLLGLGLDGVRRSELSRVRTDFQQANQGAVQTFQAVLTELLEAVEETHRVLLMPDDAPPGARQVVFAELSSLQVARFPEIDEIILASHDLIQQIYPPDEARLGASLPEPTPLRGIRSDLPGVSIATWIRPVEDSPAPGLMEVVQAQTLDGSELSKLIVRFDLGTLSQRVLGPVLGGDVSYALRTLDDTLLVGAPELGPQDAIQYRLTLNLDTWTILLMPRQGWASQFSSLFGTGVVMAVAIAVVVMVGALWGGVQNMNLRRRAVELAQANQALKDSEERARSLIEASNDAVLGLDDQQRVVLANAAAAAMFRIAKAQLLGLSLTRLIPNWDGEDSRLDVEPPGEDETPAGDATLDLSGRRSDGEVFPVEVSRSSVAWEQGRRILVLNIRDVSSRVAQAKALWRSEARYRSLTEDVLDNANVGMIILDASFCVVWVNQALEHFFGLSRADILGQRQSDLVRNRITPLFERPEEFTARVLATYMPNASMEHFECRTRATPAGEARWLEHWSQPITEGLYAGGRVEYYYDITMRKSAEERLLADQSELQAKTHSLQVLNAVADTLHRSLDFQTVARRALEFVQTYTHAPGVVLHALTPGEDSLELVLSSGMSPEMDLALAVLPVEASMSGLSARRKEILISHDTLTDERIAVRAREQLEREGYTFTVFVPLVYQDQVQGTLDLMFHGDSQLTTQELDTLWAIGATIGLAFSNARYVTQVEREVRDRERAEQAEHEERVFAEALRDSAAALNSTLELDEVLDRLLSLLAEALPPSQASAILLLEGDIARIARARLSDDAPTDCFGQTVLPVATTMNLQQMLAVGQSLIVPDTATYPDWAQFAAAPWARSFVGAPILSLDYQVIGFIGLYSTEVARYSELHAGRLQAFANQAGVAIRNARLYGEVRRQREIDSALYDLSMMLNSSLSLDATLDRLLQGALAVSNSDAANVMLIECDRIRVARARGYEGTAWDPLGLVYPLNGFTNLEWILEHRAALSIPDVTAYPGWVAMPGTEWLRSWAGVPIIQRDGTLAGLLSLDSGQVGTFGDQDMRILESFANSAAIAIDNASLFEAEQRQRETAEVLRDIALTLSSSLNQEEVLESILEQIARVIPYDGATIWLEGNQGRQALAALAGIDRFMSTETLSEARLDVNTLWAGDDATQPVLHRVDDPASAAPSEPPPGFAWAEVWAAAPLRTQGGLVGILLLGCANPEGIAPAQLPLLQTLSQQISLAIQNLHLFKMTQQYLKQLITLRHIGLEMAASQQDLFAIMDLVLDHFVRLLPADSSVVWLWDEADQQLFPLVYHQSYAFAGGEGPRLGWGEGLPGKALAQRETILDNEGSAWASSGLGSSVPLSAMLAIPLALRDESLGVLTASLTTPGATFNEYDVRLVQLFAGQVAPVMVNARLYHEVEGYASSLQELVAIRTRELEAERGQLNTILDGMTEGVIYSEGGRILYVNRAMCDQTGYGPHELKTLSSIFALMRNSEQEQETGWQQDYMERVSRALALSGVWRDEAVLQRKDGTFFDLSLTVTMIPSEDSTAATVMILRDISQEKALREEKDRFIAHASHELRTPLANMKTRLYLARKQPDKVGQHLDVMEYVTERMRGLVEDLLELSRFERGVIPLKRKEVILQTLLELVVTVQQPEAANHGIQLSLEMPESPILVFIDAARIEQVVTNLVVNAISYTLPGGQVVVRVRADCVDSKGPNRVCIEVQDTGIGISADMINRVFEPFFRVNETVAVGTGLGLPIAREIIHQHGGDLVVESEPDVGSTFRFDLRMIGSGT